PTTGRHEPGGQLSGSTRSALARTGQSGPAQIRSPSWPDRCESTPAAWSPDQDGGGSPDAGRARKGGRLPQVLLSTAPRRDPGCQPAEFWRIPLCVVAAHVFCSGIRQNSGGCNNGNAPTVTCAIANQAGGVKERKSTRHARVSTRPTT